MQLEIVAVHVPQPCESLYVRIFGVGKTIMLFSCVFFIGNSYSLQMSNK